MVCSLWRKDRERPKAGLERSGYALFHNHAAPRTPLESPWAFSTTLVATLSEKTYAGTGMNGGWQTGQVGHAAAQDDHIGIQDVDDRRKRTSEAILIPLERVGGLAIPIGGRADDVVAGARAPDADAKSRSNPGPERNVSTQPVFPQ